MENYFIMSKNDVVTTSDRLYEHGKLRAIHLFNIFPTRVEMKASICPISDTDRDYYIVNEKLETDAPIKTVALDTGYSINVVSDVLFKYGVSSMTPKFAKRYEEIKRVVTTERNLIRMYKEHNDIQHDTWYDTCKRIQNTDTRMIMFDNTINKVFRIREDKMKYYLSAYDQYLDDVKNLTDDVTPLHVFIVLLEQSELMNRIAESSKYLYKSFQQFDTNAETCIDSFETRLSRLFLQGYTNKQIAEELEISNTKVYDSLLKFGLKKPSEKVRERMNKFAELYKQGYTLEGIATKMKTSTHRLSIYKTILERENGGL